MRQQNTIDRGQTGNLDLLAVLLTVIMAGVTGYVGLSVMDTTEQTADVDTADDQTVVNESFSLTFNVGDERKFYTVSAAGDVESADDDEVVYNVSSDDSELTESTDYEWFPSNVTVRIDNTSATQDGSSNASGDYLITYNYTDLGSDFGNSSDDLTSGLDSFFGNLGTVFTVIVLVVILSYLMLLRGRR